MHKGMEGALLAPSTLYGLEQRVHRTAKERDALCQVYNYSPLLEAEQARTKGVGLRVEACRPVVVPVDRLSSIPGSMGLDVQPVRRVLAVLRAFQGLRGMEGLLCLCPCMDLSQCGTGSAAESASCLPARPRRAVLVCDPGFVMVGRIARQGRIVTQQTLPCRWSVRKLFVSLGLGAAHALELQACPEAPCFCCRAGIGVFSQVTG